ncbi:phosphotransferase enzyme family protein [Aspergillus heteromorphus CBS 117.55]|uniref:Altered inheritance of mitochondria protein 9, mitochondrial n=1 Tax=Aspergillus heteromorphus CBS 117.55 TaxID=1448321 RepID=A0A317WAX2_9EURO|nr:phosphotransferase enzyme family protein [Aspergillus heteromorphus CBS 117.55]PWY82158.1 phosphotransferase enzyme family protein [Aspergillus heteromorphus CBS 117.55]
MTSTLSPCFDPHVYSSGRWLYRDKLERDARHVDFSFEALRQKVIELCPGAVAITDCQKLEGGFNRVFIFTMDNCKQIVARLPFTLAGPARLTTASEVATVKYLQTNTSIPIPEILDWSDDAKDARNLIGHEYIIMAHADGVPLSHKWPAMAGDQRVKCIDAIYNTMKEVIDLHFPVYGSIYLTHSLPISDPRESFQLDEDFCIGPHCGTRYWDCNVGDERYYHKVNPNHGPWSNLSTYSDGLIDAGLSRLPPTNTNFKAKPPYQGSVQSHVMLLHRCRALLQQMSTHQDIISASAPVLFHPDLHKRNIFVSEHNPSMITGIIDWQGSSVEPAFWYADEVPDFAIPQEQGDDVCAKAYDVCSQFLMPRLAGPRLMDENLFRPFRYSYRTWKDGAVALRHDIIQTARQWNQLGFDGQCVYPLLSAVELARHKEEYQLFKAAQHLKRDLSSLLNSATDGWVPADRWEETNLAHIELFHGILQAVVTNTDLEDEPVKDAETLRSIWPFDIEE